MFYWYARAVKGEHVGLFKLLDVRGLDSTVLSEQFGVGDPALHVPALGDDHKGVTIVVQRIELDLHFVETRHCQCV